MPKLKGFVLNSSPSIKCFAHHHMTPAEYGFWDVCRSLSHQTGILFFDGRKLAARFQSMAKSTAYNLADSLTDSGWFKLVKESTRQGNGTFSPRQYRVLSHEQWAAEHPDRCASPVQNQGLDDDPPVQNQGLDESSPVHSENSPVHFTDSPVQNEGHNLITTTYKNQPQNHSSVQPVQNEGLVNFITRLSKRRKPRQTAKAAAPTLTGSPVPITGQVNGKQSDAERMTTTITTMGLTSPERWQAGFKSLLDAGQSLDDILGCAESLYAKAPGAMKQVNGETFPNVYWLQNAAMQGQQK